LNCRVFYHDHCFDGACSASLFARFHRECIRTADSFSYQGLVHKANGVMREDELTGDENAIVDFKYTASPKLTWWFDHHQSAFLTPEDQQHFEAGQSDGSQKLRQFFDPNYISCTGFIAHIAATNFGMDIAPLRELIHWANIVDGAKYESAKAAVELAEPAMKLTLIIESSPDATLIPKLIPLLTATPLQGIVDLPFIQEALGPQLERHHAALDLIGSRAQVRNGVLTFDITDQPTEGYSKFIPYYLHPEATYVVGLSKSSFRTKISVGTNPWTTLDADKLTNIAAICERYGGGGHARVGAISFPRRRRRSLCGAGAWRCKVLGLIHHGRLPLHELALALLFVIPEGNLLLQARPNRQSP
jgi:hypothetical protein